MKESIKVFNEMYDEFISSKNGLDLDCHEHFQKIRRQLDWHREKLKEKIDDFYMEMIEKTKEVEASYLKSLNEKLELSLKSLEPNSLEVELKSMEETFRDPNFLIESIKEMRLKQERSLNAIQTELNKMPKVKKTIKASNQFKPNLFFDKDFFGQLYLNHFPSDPFKSLILTEQQSLDLLKLCEFNSGDKFKLIYRATEHGFRAEDFHAKCDWYANTLTILKAKGTSYIFGGFTTAIWDDSDDFKSDSNAFLFSLTYKDNQSCKMKIKSS